jgi:DNA-binding NtrC family response regulator
MANPKPSPRILNRSFDRALSPVYLVSPDFVITYANPACAQWCAAELEHILALKCVFSSQPLDDHQNKIKGLCPPPSHFEPQDPPSIAPRSFTASAIDLENTTSWKSAWTYLLKDAEEKLLGLLVICDPYTSKSPPETKPESPDFLSETLHAQLAAIRAQSDRIHSLEGMVGSSSFSRQCRRRVTAAIQCDADLLITGPPGSGKEHLAKTIHAARDPERHIELLPIHCAIADQKLIQQRIKEIISELPAGGSKPKTQTWLLLLDIDRLEQAAQHELLGFLQLPEFPLRTIGTTTLTLNELTASAQFSTELTNQLGVMVIEMESLSKRVEDIPLLSQALLERDNNRRKKQLSGFANETLQLFIEFNWPENIDQLNRTIQLAALNADSALIQPDNLPDQFHQSLRAMRIGTAKETKINLDQFLREIEKELISRAMREAKGNKAKAASLLGISRPKLLRRLQNFEIPFEHVEPGTNHGDEIDSSAFEELE